MTRAGNYYSPKATPLAQRIVARIEKTDGCWLWRGLQPNGYGTIWVGGRHVVAHRLVYEHLRGPIPEGLTLDHLCRNRGCVNPDHLEPVSFRENLVRGNGWAGLNSRKTHCPKGHLLDGTERVEGRGVRRFCKTCRNAYHALWVSRLSPEERRTHRKGRAA